MSGWTFRTIKVHFDALRADDLRAVAETKSQLEKRLEGVNEFRATLADQARLLASRIEVESLEKRIQDLTDRLNRIEGRGAGLSAGWGYIVGAGGLLAGIVGVIAFFVTRQPVA